MSSWLRRCWHDPVGSKVIAGVILGVPSGVLFLWSRSGYSPDVQTALGAAGHALAGGWAWLMADAHLPHIWVGILPILFATLGFALRAAAAPSRSSAQVSAPAAGDNEPPSPNVFHERSDLPLLEAQDLSVLVAVAAHDNTDQVRTRDIAQATGLTALRTKIAFDRLTAHSLLFGNGADRAGEPIVGLTAKGREEGFRLHTLRTDSPLTALAERSTTDVLRDSVLKYLGIVYSPTGYPDIAVMAREIGISAVEAQQTATELAQDGLVRTAQGHVRLTEEGLEICFKKGWHRKPGSTRI